MNAVFKPAEALRRAGSACASLRPRLKWLLPLGTIPPGWEALLWVLLAVAAVVPRAALWHALPTYLWSSDSASYVTPAVQWLESGEASFGGRRGAVYSMLIAGCLHWGGGLNALVAVQHVLGALAILAAIVAMRVSFGRAALPAVAACGLAACLFNLPVYLEHLVRNETAILAACTAGLLAFGLALRRGCPGWAAVSGVACGITTVIKPILGPFPLVAAACLWWHGRGARRAWSTPLAFLAALAAVLATPKLLTRAGAGDFESEAYSGIQFYGRTAQWTRLQDGLYPDIKAAIAPLVGQYRALPKRDNNLVIKRLIVPVINEHLLRNPGRYPSLNKVCRQLAFEAILHQPGQFLGQAWSDFSKVHLKIANRTRLPSTGDIRDVAEEMRASADLPALLNRDATVRILEARATTENFATFEALTGRAWLFRIWPPVLWTSLLALPLIFATRGEQRLFWIAVASLWYFSVVLLSVVGKPLNRYMVPLTPVMLWALASPFILVWLGFLKWLREE